MNIYREIWRYKRKKIIYLFLEYLRFSLFIVLKNVIQTSVLLSAKVFKSITVEKAFCVLELSNSNSDTNDILAYISRNRRLIDN